MVDVCLTAFLDQLRAKAISRAESLCCILPVLTAGGAKEVEEEEDCRKPAAVILIACLPPGYGSEIEPGIIKEKCCRRRNSMRAPRVGSLRDRRSEMTFL